MLEPLVVLIAMRVEGTGDEDIGADDLTDAASELGLGAGHPGGAHGAVEGDVDAVEFAGGLELGDHLADEVLVGVGREPAGAGTGLGAEGGLDADEFDVVEFAGDGDETAHVAAGIGAQEGLTACGGTLVGEVLDGGRVLQERHGLVGEHHHRDADGLLGLSGAVGR